MMKYPVVRYVTPAEMTDEELKNLEELLLIEQEEHDRRVSKQADITAVRGERTRRANAAGN